MQQLMSKLSVLTSQPHIKKFLLCPPAHTINGSFPLLFPRIIKLEVGYMTNLRHLSGCFCSTILVKFSRLGRDLENGGTLRAEFLSRERHIELDPPERRRCEPLLLRFSTIYSQIRRLQLFTAVEETPRIASVRRQWRYCRLLPQNATLIHLANFFLRHAGD